MAGAGAVGVAAPFSRLQRLPWLLLAAAGRCLLMLLLLLLAGNSF
jgi:hypothetical protein